MSTLNDLAKIMKMLGSSKIKVVGNKSIMGSCPFAPYLHQGGSDKKPSFGIIFDNAFIYNCFACGRKGKLTSLPFTLSQFTGFFNHCLNEMIQNLTPIIGNNGAYEKPKVDCEAIHKMFFSFETAPTLWNLTNQEINHHVWKLRYDKTKESVVFPIMDSQGNIVALKGRKVHEKRFFQYNEFPIKASGLWYGMHQRQTKRVILCEGERDAILVSYLGGVAWASLGANITKEQIKTLKKSDKEFILFFDNDDAGREATQKIITECKAFNKLYLVQDYFGCKDPAELYEKSMLKRAVLNMREVNFFVDKIKRI